MAKVGAKMGFTLKISKESQYEFIRADIEISDIDTEGDVVKQLEESKKALDLTWADTVKEGHDKILAEVSTKLEAEYQLKVSQKLKQLEQMIRDVIIRLPEPTKPLVKK